MPQDELTELRVTMDYIKERLEAIEEKIDQQASSFVRREEFAPVKLIVYGFVGLLLAGVVTAILALVLRK